MKPILFYDVLLTIPKNRGLFFLIGVGGFLAQAMDENNLSPLYRMVEQVAPLYKPAEKKDFCLMGVFQANNQNLSYIKCGKSQGKNGALIFVNGKEENLLKYLELYYDFHLMGWSPIYSYDHRGQGFSKALPVGKKLNILKKKPPQQTLSNPNGLNRKEHATCSKTKDQNTPSNKTQNKNKPPLLQKNLPRPSQNKSQPWTTTCSNEKSTKSSYKEPHYELFKKDFASFVNFVLKDSNKGQNWFAIAHSMGGAIILDYLQAVGSHSPFQAVALSAPMIQIQPRVFKRDFSLSLLQGVCRRLACQWRIPSLRGQWTKKSFTSSRKRFAFSKHITKQFPQARSRGTSLNWLIESFELGQRFMEEKSQPFQQISVPFLILQSPKDGFVSNESQNIFCARLKACYQIASIPGRHEIFLEKDLSRNQAITATARFFLKNQK